MICCELGTLIYELKEKVDKFESREEKYDDIITDVSSY
jgi:hypothetical protein